MSQKEKETLDHTVSSKEQSREALRDDPLADTSQFISKAIPPGVDRRTFLMRSAVVRAGGGPEVLRGAPTPFPGP
jgi:hypothetical protein